MRKAKWMLPLTTAVSILFLLVTASCGGAEGSSNASVNTPIQRIQSMELGLLGIQADLAEGIQSYESIQGNVDQVREDLDALVAQLNELNAECECPITEAMYNEVTANITTLQRVSFTLHMRIDALEDSINGS